MNLAGNPFLNGQVGSINSLQHNNGFNNNLESKNAFSISGQVVDQEANGFLGVQPKPFGTNHPGNRCEASGQVCVPVELCVNGYVNINGAGQISNRFKVSEDVFILSLYTKVLVLMTVTETRGWNRLDRNKSTRRSTEPI